MSDRANDTCADTMQTEDQQATTTILVLIMATIAQAAAPKTRMYHDIEAEHWLQDRERTAMSKTTQRTLISI